MLQDTLLRPGQFPALDAALGVHSPEAEVPMFSDTQCCWNKTGPIWQLHVSESAACTTVPGSQMWRQHGGSRAMALAPVLPWTNQISLQETASCTEAVAL